MAASDGLIRHGGFKAFSPAPPSVDRVVVHQFDAARPSPGGIDTCLRGICRYLPQNRSFAFVGVDAGGDIPGRKLGQWEQYDRGSGVFWFMPVTRLDPGNQQRRLPHSLRVVLGALRYYKRIPRAEWFQAHRMDTAWSLRRLIGKRHAYFIHTQEGGLTGKASDSFWRIASNVHERLERAVVRDAAQVVVFNNEYAKIVSSWNPLTLGSPTWYDPDLIFREDPPSRDSHSVIWVGRLEYPKDPLLAIDAFSALVESTRDSSWRLDMVGSGTLGDQVADVVKQLPEEVRCRVTLHGRTAPTRVAELMAGGGVFLMTSRAGYEGYPRVLVEALASGLPAVVTQGADTGALISDNHNGFTTDRDPQELAARLVEASSLPRAVARASVEQLSAPDVIRTIYRDTNAGDPQ